MDAQAEVIAKLRQLQVKGWTLRGIAQELGVSRITVSTWVNGRYRPSPTVSVALDRLMRMRPVGARKPGPKGKGGG